MEKYQPVVCLDCDGTIIRELLIQAVGAVLPPAAARELAAINRRYLQSLRCGQLTLERERASIFGSVRVFARHGLKLADAAAAISRIQLRPGVRDGLSRLNAAGARCVIVSSGIADFIRQLLEQSDARHLVQRICALELKADENGRVTGCLPDTVVLTSRKGEWARKLMYDFGTIPTMMLGVGDTLGDRSIVPTRLNRLGVGGAGESLERLRTVMSDVVDVSAGFGPATDWLLARLEKLRSAG